MSLAPTSQPSSRSCCPLFSSSIGRKWIVALTGICLIGFITVHLLGNLSIFLGSNAVNAYAEKLHGFGQLLWVARLGLLLVAGLHIYFTMLLWAENRRATPKKYEVEQKLKTTVYARSMRLSGLVILGFVLFHLAQFTWQWVNPEYCDWHDQMGRHDVYRMLVSAFSNPWVAGFYLLSVGLLAMHLSHGIASLFQTLGLTTAKLRPCFERAGLIIAWVFFLGYASIPVSIFLGLLPR